MAHVHSHIAEIWRGVMDLQTNSVVVNVKVRESQQILTFQFHQLCKLTTQLIMPSPKEWDVNSLKCIQIK